MKNITNRIIRRVEGDPTPDTPHPPHPDTPTPHPDTPPTPAPPTPEQTAPEHTQTDDVHRTLAAITQSLAELQNTVAGLVADGVPVEKTDPAPKTVPWTHRRFGGSK